jgi:uncharacterized Zn-binding protein involved in type VI secretion
MGIAKATLPNVCKMPGPPAPFIPSPLPNIAKSGSSPKGYSTTVKIEGHTVAIRGAMFESMGDMASKGTGGGLISANTHGPAKFITPGSMTVKIEGKAVHLLGEPMLNNCGPSGSPPNTGATMMGLDQAEQKKWDDRLQQLVNECDKEEDEKYGPRASNCEESSGETMRKYNPETRKYETVDKPIAVKLGELKEECVYRKMGFEPNPETGKCETGTKSTPGSKSVTIQQRFNSSASPLPYSPPTAGSICPDVLYKGTEGEISCIRDLKFRCPKGQKQHKKETEQMERYSRILKAPSKIIQPR